MPAAGEKAAEPQLSSVLVVTAFQPRAVRRSRVTLRPGSAGVKVATSEPLSDGAAGERPGWTIGGSEASVPRTDTLRAFVPLPPLLPCLLPCLAPCLLDCLLDCAPSAWATTWSEESNRTVTTSPNDPIRTKRAAAVRTGALARLTRLS